MIRGQRAPWLLLVAVASATVLALRGLGEGWAGLEVLFDAESRSAAFGRLGEFLAAFTRPELGGEFLLLCGELGIATLAIAILGTVGGVFGGFVLALGSSRCFDAAAGGRAGFVRRALRGAARLLQDVLRGVPDLAWVLLVIPFVGVGPLAGVLALALNVSGILARVYSELFDAVPHRRLEALRFAGARPLQLLGYGLLPELRGPLLSFTLLRWECCIRSAAVVGAVAGGGLGSEVVARLSYGEYEKVLTLLGCLLLLTFLSDRFSDRVRRSFSVAGRPADAAPVGSRAGLGFGCVLAVLLSAVWVLSTSTDLWGQPFGERLQAAFRLFGASSIDELHTGGILVPDPAVLPRAFAAAGDTLSMAWLGTLLAVLTAGLLAGPGSRILQASGNRTPEPRGGLVAAGLRGVALLARTIPELVWALLLLSFLRAGPLSGMLALGLHSFGLLLRLFVESVDGTPRERRQIVTDVGGNRTQTLLYGVLPGAAPHWIANGFFQLEANVRTGVVLGLVGAGGLGWEFKLARDSFHMREAATYLLLMVGLAIALDRISRALGFARGRLG